MSKLTSVKRNKPLRLGEHILKLSSNDRGFTLIEILVALGILTIVAGVGIRIFLSITQAYNKSVVVNRLRGEGSRVMEEISRVIRSGSDLTGGGSTLTVALDDGSLEYAQNGECTTVVFSLEVPAVGDDYNTRIVKSLADCLGTPTGVGPITNDDRVSGVNVTNLDFTITDGGNLRPDRASISLVLTQGLDAINRKEYQAEVNLTSSVSTRGY